MAYAQKNALLLGERAGPLEEERGSTYWCMPTILYSSFSILFNPSFLSFFFLVFSMFTYLLRFFARGYYSCVPDCDRDDFAMHGKGPLYSACCDRILLF